ncbi:hypothetical protein GH714_024362 [Hevea brasiliensis]|uniref:Uncharacterized protein n=1 Tax=Hevea brasiliensis TaxID=3981 RepID=A0A6A6LJ47_HEVBR|nr:hypothetical protein GH714_024362 [Hevea brasiliensis]
MSSLQYSFMSSNPNPNFDEHLWIISIRRSLEEELESDSEVPASIFNVPKILMASDPNSYTPQQVAIGLTIIGDRGRKSAHNAILRDMVMLENQIPLFVLRKILEFNSQH